MHVAGIDVVASSSEAITKNSESNSDRTGARRTRRWICLYGFCLRPPIGTAAALRFIYQRPQTKQSSRLKPKKDSAPQLMSLSASAHSDSDWQRAP